MSLPAWIAPQRTALMIVDMQVDFAAPEGLSAQWGMDLSAVPGALAAAQRLAEAARAAGTPVVFVGLFTTPETDSDVWGERLRRQGHTAEDSPGLCRAGAPGSAFVGPQPQADDLVFRKTRYSPFWDTDIAARLRSMGVDTLVLAGLTTECCIDSTARDAFNHDFHVFVSIDACAAYEPELHAAALRMLELNTAILTDSDSVVVAWRSAV
ncbi:cysteine hydrolase [Caulobacter vibrioides]|uniref:Isochorismatase family protein n=2 Tax=Caulobacter vibrioides TaxID=155892 RepID=Q9A924_CAUVC|nr:cysteine hydrolase [Caulobacter vibrioides]YP_002516601.1 pyrazinamidase/nicotinamidase [Caulobacter vibrioides NA1000]AAK23154.1 isochorismatase family protein [Caulobacter vibrioides CB15]ACL94693.1 pyrazinamidase/nicotinamidase [Caulobacter vibrioides NA1000]ATC27995.1 cysteine hydrolase [Caulobacter vibrioides]QXZ53252.1 cysteine hydrolase [Caulobacter vibrioides]